MTYPAAVPATGSWSVFRPRKKKTARPPRADPHSQSGMIRRKREEGAVIPPIPGSDQEAVGATSRASAPPIRTARQAGRVRGGAAPVVPLVTAMAPHGDVDIGAMRREYATPARRKVEMPYYARELMDPAQRAMAQQNRVRLQQESARRIGQRREPSLRGTIAGPRTPLLEFSPEQAGIARGQPVPATAEQIQSQIGLMGAGQMAPRAAEETLAQQSLVRGQRAYEAAMARFMPQEVQDPTQINRQGMRVANLRAAELEMQAAQTRLDAAETDMQIPGAQQQQTRTDVLASMRATDLPAPIDYTNRPRPPVLGERGPIRFNLPPEAYQAPDESLPGALPRAMPGDIAAQQARFGLAPPIPAPPIPQPGAMAAAPAATGAPPGLAEIPPIPGAGTVPPIPAAGGPAYWNQPFEAQLAGIRELEKGRIFTPRPDLARMLQEQQYRHGEAAMTQAEVAKQAQGAVNALEGLGTLPLEEIPSNVEAIMRPLSSDARTYVMTEAMSRNEDGTPRYSGAVRDAFSKYARSAGGTAQMDRGVGGGGGILPTKEQVTRDTTLIVANAFAGYEGAQFWGPAIKAFLEDPRLETYIRNVATDARSAGVPLGEIAGTIQDGIWNATYSEILAKAPEVSMGGPPEPFRRIIGAGASREDTARRLAGDINLKIREKVYEEYRRLGKTAE